MLNFFRKRRHATEALRAARDDLLQKATACQLHINDLDRQIESQQVKLRDLVEKGKRESSEMGRLGLAEKHLQGERKVRRLRAQRRTFVEAMELAEVHLADLELQAAIPDKIVDLSRPELQQERAMAELFRARIKQAHEELLATAEGTSLDGHLDSQERASVQAVLDLFDRERDNEFRATLRAIEEDLDSAVSASFYTESHQQGREVE